MASIFWILQSSNYDSSQCVYGIAGIVMGVIWGAVCSNIMKKKGRSQGAGWALGFFLGLIGVLICALLSNKLETQPYGQQMKYDEMRCPHCQNIIKIGAAVCTYCGRDPRVPPSAPPQV